MTYDTAVSENLLSKNWQRLILTHLQEKNHRGVLTGSPITDISITLIGGKAHLKHTEGGDFRQATYRAVRQGLKKAKSVLLEPYYDFVLTVPQENVGKAMTDISNMEGNVNPPETKGDKCILTGYGPVSTMWNYINDVNELSAKLNQYNKERQEIEKNIFAEAVKQIERDNLENNTTITLLGKNWHHGVIGIVASKITEMYYKPSILLCEEDGIGKGSGRSIPGFDLYETLTECKDSIDRFGGHEMAVGITIDKEKFEEFREKFEEKAKEKHIEEIIPILKIDSQLSLDEIDKQTVDSLKAIEPFGEENKNPLFLFKNLKIDSIRALTEGKHLKLTVKENKNIVNAIGFNLGTLANEYKIGDKVDIVGNLEMNSFNGVDSIQINIKDIMKSL